MVQYLVDKKLIRTDSADSITDIASCWCCLQRQKSTIYNKKRFYDPHLHCQTPVVTDYLDTVKLLAAKDRYSLWWRPKPEEKKWGHKIHQRHSY